MPPLSAKQRGCPYFGCFQQNYAWHLSQSKNERALTVYHRLIGIRDAECLVRILAKCLGSALTGTSSWFQAEVFFRACFQHSTPKLSVFFSNFVLKKQSSLVNPHVITKVQGTGYRRLSLGTSLLAYCTRWVSGTQAMVPIFTKITTGDHILRKLHGGRDSRTGFRLVCPPSWPRLCGCPCPCTPLRWGRGWDTHQDPPCLTGRSWVALSSVLH